MMGAERSRAEEARGSTPSRGAKTHWLQAGQTNGDVGAPDVHGASRFFSYRCGAVQAEYAAQHDEARSERNMAWIDRCSWCNTDWPWWWASPLSSHCPRTSLAWRRAEQIPFSFLVAAASKQNKAPPPPVPRQPTTTYSYCAGSYLPGAMPDEGQVKFHATKGPYVSPRASSRLFPVEDRSGPPTLHRKPDHNFPTYCTASLPCLSVFYWV
jgi:hypothetical protein